MSAAGIVIEGSVSFEVTSLAGMATGRISGEGQHLVVHTSDPVVALDAAGAPGGGLIKRRRSYGALGDLLAAQGLTVDVVGASGPIVSIGAGVTSLLGSALVGSQHVHLRSLRAAWGLLRADRKRRRSVR